MAKKKWIGKSGIVDEGDKPKGLKNKIRDRLYNNIVPLSYDDPIKRIFNALILNKKEEVDPRLNEEYVDYIYDAYAMYLDKPQENDSFIPSKYKPSISKDNSATYYAYPKLEEKLKKKISRGSGINLSGLDNLPIEEEIKKINATESSIYVDPSLGTFKVGTGKDEKGNYISYYDIWDVNPYSGAWVDSDKKGKLLNKILENKKDISIGIGKPFEIYNRIYYNENTDYKDFISKNKELYSKFFNQLETFPSVFEMAKERNIDWESLTEEEQKDLWNERDTTILNLARSLDSLKNLVPQRNIILNEKEMDLGKKKKKQDTVPIGSATAGVDSDINWDAIKYNEFFGPIQEELKILQSHGEKTGNKRLAMASVLGQKNIGNYTEEPLMKSLFRKEIPDIRSLKGKALRTGIKTKAGIRKLIDMSSGMDANTASDFAFPGSNLTKEQKMAISDKALPWIRDYIKDEYGVFGNAAKPDEILRRIYKESPEMFDLEEKSLGGILGTTASGIGAGATFGPIGGIVGGGLGLLTGILGHSKEKKAEEQMLRQQEEMKQNILLARKEQISSAQQAGNLMVGNEYAPTFAQGGIVYGGNDAELEGGEVTKAPGLYGSLTKVIGPSHKYGGVPVSAEEGTRVFSKDLGFADRADTIRKKMLKYEKILNS